MVKIFKAFFIVSVKKQKSCSLLVKHVAYYYNIIANISKCQFKGGISLARTNPMDI